MSFAFIYSRCILNDSPNILFYSLARTTTTLLGVDEDATTRNQLILVVWPRRERKYSAGLLYGLVTSTPMVMVAVVLLLILVPPPPLMVVLVAGQ